jgi:hypothetical protein
VERLRISRVGFYYVSIKESFLNITKTDHKANITVHVQPSGATNFVSGKHALEPSQIKEARQEEEQAISIVRMRVANDFSCTLLARAGYVMLTRESIHLSSNVSFGMEKVPSIAGYVGCAKDVFGSPDQPRITISSHT